MNASEVSRGQLALDGSSSGNGVPNGELERKLLIEVRSVYGNEVAYPINETAKLFARIAGTKTLSPQTLAYAKALGYRVAFALRGREITEVA